jgi:hypothetical protein
MLEWAKRFFIVYILTSPYYLFDSGGIQISTVFLTMSIALMLTDAAVHKSARTNLVNYARTNRNLLTFVALATVINAIYYLVAQDASFIMSSLYLIFNFLVILTFFGIKKDQKFFQTVKWSLVANIVVQLLICAIGFGRYHPTDTFRYMGTFNDPNQLAFYIFLALLFIYVINILSKKLRTQNDWIIWFLGVVLILLASSTGVFLGLAAFGVGLIVFNRKAIAKLAQKHLAISIITGCLVVSGAVGTTVIIFGQTDTGIPTIDRLRDKATEDDGRNLLEDRGLDTVVHYPENLLYGSGEGDMTRFDKQKNGGNEIHSSLIALLFYYGIIPFVLFIKWLRNTVKKVDPRIKIAFVALLVESFTLINYRQSLLWILLILPSLPASYILNSAPRKQQGKKQ